MLSFAKLIAFVPTKDAKKARQFYEGVLGLGFVSEDQFAVVLDAHGFTDDERASLREMGAVA